MADKLAKLKLGLDILRLYVLLIPLQIAGIVLLLVGLVSLGSFDKSGPAPTERLTGVVTRKIERPVPNRDIVAYGLEIAPAGKAGETVTRFIEKRKWDAVGVGDRWEDPKSSGGLTQPMTDLGTAIKEVGLGLLLLFFANMTRKAILKKREAMNGSGGEAAGSVEFSKLARALAERAEKMKAAGKPSYQASAKTPPPKPVAAKPVIRSSTVKRAGWF